MAMVWIPTTLRHLSGGQETVEIAAANVRQIVEELDRRFPGIKARLCDGTAMHSGVAIAVDGQIANLGLLQPVKPESEVHFVMAIGGGSKDELRSHLSVSTFTAGWPRRAGFRRR